MPLSVVNDLIARFGAAGAVALLNSQITSATAVAAGIRPPYPNFTNPAVQTTRSVAQALRPFPQYATVNTTASGGDKTGRSMYHAGVLKLTQRLTDGFLFQGSYTYSRLMTNADTFSGSTGSMDTAQPDLEYLDRPVRSAAQHQAEHRLRVAVWTGTPLGDRTASSVTSSAAGGSQAFRSTPAACRSA